MKTRLVPVLALAAAIMLLGGTAWAQEEKPAEGGGSSGSEPGSVRPEQIEPLQVNEIALTSGGRSVESAPAGAEVVMALKVTNYGEQAANDVTIQITATEGAARVTRGSGTIGDLASNETGGVTLSAEILEAGCQDFTGFVATFKSSLGEQQTKFGIPVLCPGPRLYVEEVRYVGGDGDNSPEPGERLDVVVTLRNSGRDAATGVGGTITIPQTEVTVVKGTSNWPDIAPGAAAISAPPFTIEIARDAKVQEGCPGMVVEDGTVRGEPDSSDEPTSSEDGGTPTQVDPAPAPGEPGPGGEPVEETDPAVMFEAQLKLQASDRSFDAAFGSGMFCTMMESRTDQKGAPAPGAPADARDEAALTALGSKSAGKGDRSGPIAFAAVLIAGVGAMIARVRFAR